MSPSADGGIAVTPEPPYLAVIFTSLRTPGDRGYAAMAQAMADLVRDRPGYLGMESARDGLGITVSYWRDEASARSWKAVVEHLAAQQQGREEWYADYRVRAATVTREYGAATSELESRGRPGPPAGGTVGGTRSLIRRPPGPTRRPPAQDQGGDPGDRMRHAPVALGSGPCRAGAHARRATGQGTGRVSRS